MATTLIPRKATTEAAGFDGNKEFSSRFVNWDSYNSYVSIKFVYCVVFLADVFPYLVGSENYTAVLQHGLDSLENPTLNRLFTMGIEE